MAIDPFTGAAAAKGAQALLGGVAGALSKSGKIKQYNIARPDQIAASQWANQYGMNQIQNPYEGFQPIANQARTNFAQQTVPSLVERFTGSTGGATSSPALYSQLGQAGAGLEGQIAALQSQYGLDQQRLGQSLFGMGQQPTFENYYQPGRNTFLSGLLGNAAGGAGDIGNFYGMQAALSPSRPRGQQSAPMASRNYPGQTFSSQTYAPQLPYTQGGGLGLGVSALEGMQMPYTPGQGQQNFQAALGAGYGSNPLAYRSFNPAARPEMSGYSYQPYNNPYSNPFATY